MKHTHKEYGNITLQCAANTKKGSRCKITITAWNYINDPDFTRNRTSGRCFPDPDWWVCGIHAPVCPHCAFVSKRRFPCTFSVSHLVLSKEAGNFTGRGLTCMSCFCQWDPRLNPIEHGDQLCSSEKRIRTVGWWNVVSRSSLSNRILRVRTDYN
jgi:hypothetical protein